MNLNMSGNGKIVIDGREFSGNNLQIKGGKVIVDGVTQDGELIGEISVEVHGNVESIENSNGPVSARDVGSIRTSNGRVTCNSVKGSVTTTNGRVECGAVGGSVSTVNGRITHE